MRFSGRKRLFRADKTFQSAYDVSVLMRILIAFQNASQAKALLHHFFESNDYDAVTSLGEYIDDFARTQ
jgi:hypothetical protein